MPTIRPAAFALAAALALVSAPMAPPASAQSPASAPTALAIVPAPTSVTRATGRFPIDTSTAIVIDAGASAAAEDVARYLAELLAPTVGAPRRLAAGAAAPRRSIHLTAAGADASLGEEGYTLTVGADRVTIAARAPAGLFHGVQTLRQLLPTSVEHRAALNRGLALPAVRVMDSPRFAWRGAMLDVSRHFLPLDAVKRYVDVMALYKLNRLHLHLADDQGWRIEIRSRPELARIGGASEVGGGPGGYYTQAEYSDLVAYAARRHIVIVPEIDMPGHTNAALASIPALNCDDRARPIYTGTRVGFSAVCVERDTTYAIITDILRELAELTPGDYLHIGGDEVEKLTHKQYVGFIERVQGIVRAQ
ncbi:MAG: beta-N-acetylhexosaminidase, partial [Gemmatimonadaceae bacterium]